MFRSILRDRLHLAELEASLKHILLLLPHLPPSTYLLIRYLVFSMLLPQLDQELLWGVSGREMNKFMKFGWSGDPLLHQGWSHRLGWMPAL